MIAWLRLPLGAVVIPAIGLLLVVTVELQRPQVVVDPVIRSGPQQYVVPVAAGVPAARSRDTASRSAGRGYLPAQGWVQRTSASAGIPVPAVRAYGRAELRASVELHECRLGWTTLAGIGYIESHHGTIGGRHLLDDGRSAPPVLGIALDGTHGTAAIPATPESARWHGDPRWDHAVGPLQFIPSTWQRWASDGDGDGRADPNDLDDAAWAAARYLCADGRNLASGLGWSGAVFAYNHAEAYVRAVFDAADAYGADADGAGTR